MTPRPCLGHTRRVKEGTPLMEFLLFAGLLALCAHEFNPAKDQ